MIKKIEPKFACDIARGKIKIRERDKFDEYILSLPEDVYWVILKRYKKERSDKQNRYFHGVVIPLATQFLYEAGLLPYEDLEMGKQLLKSMFLKEYEFTFEGKVFAKTKETRTLKTDQMEEFLEAVRRYFREEHNFKIPEPNEVDWNNYPQEAHF